MYCFSSFKTQSFLAFVLMLTACFGAIVGHAQVAPPSPPQNIGSIDPRLDDYSFFRHRNHNQLKNSQAAAAANQKADASPTAGELDASLNVSIDSYPGNVRATVVQPDGKILVGGYFRTVNGARQKSLVRLNADLSFDSTFSADVNGTVFAVAVQADGKIVIGGSFLSVGGVSRSRIARLNPNGSLDTTFNPGAGADNLIYDIIVQPDGKILVGGNFSAVNSVNNYGVARLNANGSVDASFVSPIPVPVPSPNLPFPIASIVFSIALQADGKIILAGFIVTSANGQTILTKSIVRLNTNGAFDPSFDVGNINSTVVKVIVQPDGKILAAGSFSLINGVNRNYIARFNSDGSLDHAFNNGAGPSAPVDTIHLQPDGKILLGGLFSTVNGTTRNRLARLNADGSLDQTFNPSGSFILGTIRSIALLPNGKVFIGGSFGGSFNFAGDSAKVFNADGSADTVFRFDTTALGGVRAIAVQPDGKILVGGNFTRPRSGAITQLFRLNVDGTLDETFAPASSSFSSSGSGQINSIVIQPDGKILIAGLNIGVVSGTNLVQITSLARLNADGTPDGSFVLGSVPTVVGGINHVALQADGKILVVWGDNLRGGLNGGVARLNSDGSVDSSFNSALPAALYNSIVVQPDGKILVGGDFSISYVNSQTGTVSYNGVVRLNSDGSRDATFVPATVTESGSNKFTRVFALARQADGKILIGGSIFTGNAAAPTGVARLNLDGTLDTTFNSGAISSGSEVARVEDIFVLPNGKILIGGFFSGIGAVQKNNVARLNADGSVDNSFISSADNTVYEITVQADGRVLIGGDFSTLR